MSYATHIFHTANVRKYFFVKRRIKQNANEKTKQSEKKRK